MIQRLQTVFLFLAFLAFGLLFKYPFAGSEIQSAGFLADKQYNIFDNIFLIVLTSVGGLIALSAIFLFKNRILQLRFSNLSIVINILILIVAVVLFYNEAKNLLDNNGEIFDAAGLYMPFAGILFGILASVYIKKDEKIVRNMDRLR
jgi:glucan phosphoethanolaminetransferase (alkaline phosphatase superfamily)